MLEFVAVLLAMGFAIGTVILIAERPARGYRWGQEAAGHQDPDTDTTRPDKGTQRHSEAHKREGQV